MPKWTSQNLSRHHLKRTTGKDAGCFEDLLKINGRVMTVKEYEQRSQRAFGQAWAEYEGEAKDVNGGVGVYLGTTAYFIDDDVVVAITDLARQKFITCFHEHFGRPHAKSTATLGQRQLRYKQHLGDEERGGMIRNVRRIRGAI